MKDPVLRLRPGPQLLHLAIPEGRVKALDPAVPAIPEGPVKAPDPAVPAAAAVRVNHRVVQAPEAVPEVTAVVEAVRVHGAAAADPAKPMFSKIV